MFKSKPGARSMHLKGPRASDTTAASIFQPCSKPSGLGLDCSATAQRRALEICKPTFHRLGEVQMEEAELSHPLWLWVGLMFAC